MTTVVSNKVDSQTVSNTADGLGTAINSLSSGTQVALLTATGPTLFINSTVNSTVAQLIASAIFTGTAETILNATNVVISCISDQPGLLTIIQYDDAGGTKIVASWPFTIPASTPFNRSFVVNGNYLKLTYQNTGASTTTTFLLDTYYGTIPAVTQLGNSASAIAEVGSVSLIDYLPVANSVRVVKGQANYSLTAAVSLATAAGGSVPPGSVVCEIQAGSTAINLTFDGSTTPTALVGVVLAAGATYVVRSPLANVKLFAAAASVVQMVFFDKA
jgi:hypothetical protein